MRVLLIDIRQVGGPSLFRLLVLTFDSYFCSTTYLPTHWGYPASRILAKERSDDVRYANNLFHCHDQPPPPSSSTASSNVTPWVTRCLPPNYGDDSAKIVSSAGPNTAKIGRQHLVAMLSHIDTWKIATPRNRTALCLPRVQQQYSRDLFFLPSRALGRLRSVRDLCCRGPSCNMYSLRRIAYAATPYRRFAVDLYIKATDKPMPLLSPLFLWSKVYDELIVPRDIGHRSHDVCYVGQTPLQTAGSAPTRPTRYHVTHGNDRIARAKCRSDSQASPCFYLFHLLEAR